MIELESVNVNSITLNEVNMKTDLIPDETVQRHPIENPLSQNTVDRVCLPYERSTN